VAVLVGQQLRATARITGVARMTIEKLCATWARPARSITIAPVRGVKASDSGR